MIKKYIVPFILFLLCNSLMAYNEPQSYEDGDFIIIINVHDLAKKSPKPSKKLIDSNFKEMSSEQYLLQAKKQAENSHDGIIKIYKVPNKKDEILSFLTINSEDGNSLYINHVTKNLVMTVVGCIRIDNEEISPQDIPCAKAIEKAGITVTKHDFENAIEIK